MVLVFRDTKGSNLTAAEADGNIRTLRDLIQDVADNPTPGVGITDISQEPGSSVITIHLSNGQTHEVTLPRANLRYRGDWQPETFYLNGDWVKVANEGLYLVIQEHTSAETFNADEDLGSGPVYDLAVPYMTPPEGWQYLEIETDGSVTPNLVDSDKFILELNGETSTINVPINGYNGQPFALRIRMIAASSVSWGVGYLGANPSVLGGVGDETVLSGLMLDVGTASTAVINTVKEIPA
jgi:hypothetical protein